MIPDSELLQAYVRGHSETAFRELVDRHIGLVYSAALRQTGRRETAEDVVQVVFLIFARKAGRMKPGTIITGWLYRATRLAAAHVVRDELRRTARERAAVVLAAQEHSSEEADWERIGPLLDAGLQRLRHKDRDALLLRFFQDRSLAEVGSALGCSEEAARKRVDRALERLRKYFRRRDAWVSVAALSGAISTQAQQAPPAGLAHTACAVAFQEGATTSVTIINLAKETMKTMLWSKAPFALGLAVLLVALTTVPLLLRGQPGLVDPDFVSRLPVTNSGSITALALQSDSRILVAGSYACYPELDGRQVPYVGLARLHPDGTVDGTFRSFDERGIAAMAVQKDGKILVGGNWSKTNALKRANLCRLNADGSIDPTFDPGPGTDWRPPPTVPTSTPFSSMVRTLALQADGRILIGGDFHEVGGESHPALARLNQDGTVDGAFDPPTRSGDQIQRLLVQEDGKILVSAAFNDPLPAQVTASVLRLNPDGSVDSTFRQSPDIRGSRPMALQKNGQIVACLKPASFPGLEEPVRLVRLNADGSVDPAFSTVVSLTNVDRPYPQLFAIVSAPGGKNILLGKFNRVNGVPQNDLARLNPDGSVDATFQSSLGFESLTNLSVKIETALLQSDGKILFGGTFGKVNGVRCESLARVLGDAPLWFANVRLGLGGALQATLSGGPETGIYLESSTDLKQWTRVTAASAYPQVLEPDVLKTPGTATFYRAVVE